ncbi:MAG: PAS domain S-box protein, partial [Deltaproteobacteria bacterium]|nr:PAS domain S-box protein [Deltaproteobacteria bacterium]
MARRKSGELFWGETNLKHAVINGQERILAFVSDITERKKAEKALKESEENLTQAQELAHLGYWKLDVETKRVMGTKELFSIFGIGPDEADLEAFVEVVHPEDREDNVSYIQQGMEHGTPWDIEHRLVLKDGTLKWVHAIGKAIEGENGSIVSLMGITQDITQQKQLEYALGIAKAKAEAADKSKSEFLANMGHEIRTPMNAIIGFSQLLLKQADALAVPDDFKHSLNNILAGGNTLERLINDILDLSKIDTGNMTVSGEIMSLKQLLETVFNVNRARAEKKGLEFSYQLDAALPEFVRSDPARLNQVLMNLISNAIKFTPEGKAVLLKALKTGDKILFQVIDQGIGIAAEKQEAIFSPFEQMDRGTTRRYEGTGLGLALVKKIVELLQGSITVESKADQGSVFSVAIPLVEGETPESTPRLDGERPAFLQDNVVLVVEDNPMNQEFIIALLEELGVESHLAENGEQGIEKTLELKPDVVLMDIHMPVMDG